jgi:hypothetical protein
MGVLVQVQLKFNSNSNKTFHKRNKQKNETNNRRQKLYDYLGIPNYCEEDQSIIDRRVSWNSTHTLRATWQNYLCMSPQNQFSSMRKRSSIARDVCSFPRRFFSTLSLSLVTLLLVVSPCTAGEGVGAFVATNKWQEIVEGQAVPKGLHVKMDFESGKK